MNKKFNNNKKRPYSGKKVSNLDREEKVLDKGIPTKNDWKFYAADEQIAKDVASLPFNYLGGTPFRLKSKSTYVRRAASGGDPVEMESSIATKGSSLPSVMRVGYVNSVGVTNKRTQGINMAATQLYTMIRHKNSGAKNYEAADVMMYILAMRDIYSEYFTLKKILGVSGLFNYYNHAFPDAILAAHNINATDLRANLAQYRGKLNLLARKINSFAVPNYFKVFDRSIFIASYLFGDSDSIRGQMYTFDKDGYYTWSGMTDNKGTELVFTEHDKTNKLFSHRLDVLESMLDALFLDEDALTMSGDILKAFDDSGLYNVASTDENYIVNPVHDADILAQIQNSVCLPIRYMEEKINNSYANPVYKCEVHFDFNIKQENQIIKFEPTVRFTDSQSEYQTPVLNMISYENLVLNSMKDKPDFKDVLEWTRLMTSYEYGITILDNNPNTWVSSIDINLRSTGLEIVTGYDIVYHNSDGEPAMHHFENLDTAVHSLITKFDFHPIVYNANRDSNTPDYFGDTKVVTLIDIDTLDKINDAAVYGALYGNKLYNS